LMLAYGEDEHRVNVRHVRLAAADTPGVRAPVPWWLSWQGVWRGKRSGAKKASTKQFQDDRSGGAL